MKKGFLLILALLTFNMVFAQTVDTIKYPRLKLELQLFDLPYQLDAAKTAGNGNICFGTFIGGFGLG